MDKSRVEPTIFFIEKILFSIKLFSGHFMGNPSLRLSEVLASQEQIETGLYIKSFPGRELDLRLRGHWFNHHLRHCVVSLSETLYPTCSSRSQHNVVD